MDLSNIRSLPAQTCIVKLPKKIAINILQDNIYKNSFD